MARSASLHCYIAFPVEIRYAQIYYKHRGIGLRSVRLSLAAAAFGCLPFARRVGSGGHCARARALEPTETKVGINHGKCRLKTIPSSKEFSHTGSRRPSFSFHSLREATEHSTDNFSLSLRTICAEFSFGFCFRSFGAAKWRNRLQLCNIKINPWREIRAFSVRATLTAADEGRRREKQGHKKRKYLLSHKGEWRRRVDRNADGEGKREFGTRIVQRLMGKNVQNPIQETKRMCTKAVIAMYLLRQHPAVCQR